MFFLVDIFALKHQLSQRMTPSSSRLNSLKDYLSPREFRLSLPSRRPLTPGEHGYLPDRTTPQSWGQWAGQKIRRNNELVSTIDEVNLFPGWATERLPIPAADGHEDAFNVSLHISGFATSRRTPELITRSQRAFLKLAKEYTSEPLHLPPRPDEIADDYEVQNLDKQFQNSESSETISEMDEFPFSESVQCSSQMSADRNIPADLQRLHANLESRLKPFWASALSSRWVEVLISRQSNSPFELLPVINQFIKISNLPPGSIRLRSYAGRSLFNGLLSAPSTRKRANVIEVLDHFPGSNFILVGDSGEQDLELYASLAVDRPRQIIGVFIRDVCAVGLDNPTGASFPPTNPAMTPASKRFSISQSHSDRRFPRRASSDTEMQVVGPHRHTMQIPRPTPAKTFPPTTYSLETISEPASLGSLRGIFTLLEYVIGKANATDYGGRKEAMGPSKPGKQGAISDA
ncbi:hypothetical protein PAXINDRAFT_178316 [Paxillus involutus ATCC 200175]|nr:hypothetical protein PAXINDRAFT_178316 [Paxillus involutus ATCC 200175]